MRTGRPSPRYRVAGARAVTLAVAMLAGLSLLIAPAAASAKSFTMPSVSIEAAVGADGALSVQETRSFDFSGDYTRVYWDLEAPAGGSITDISVARLDGTPLPPAQEDGRPAGFSRVIDQGATTRVEAYGAWSNEVATFVLRYRVTGAAVRWADTGELYWQAITANWAQPTGTVKIVVRPPDGATKADVKAWAHGPLTGLVVIGDDGAVTLEVSDLPANTFVEPRVLFPAESLSSVAPRSERRLDAVLAEEGALADKANRVRAEARFQIVASSVIGILVPLLALAGVIALFLRFGKEHKPSFSGQYYREVPADINPALVAHLWTMGSVRDEALSACLMDLADRGVIRMEPTTVSKPGLFGASDEPTFLLTLDTAKWDSLDLIDQGLLSFLFTTIAGDGTLTIAEMRDWAKEHPSEFQTGMGEIRAEVDAAATSEGFVEPGSRSASVASWIVTVCAGVAAGFGAVSAESLVVGLVGGAATIAMVVLSANMTRRSPAAAELYAKYVALRNYLRDFSRLQEAPPASVVLWNRFLVLAVVFGIADVVIEQLKVTVPQIVADPGFATTYWWVASGPGYDAPISSMASGFTSAAQAATSAMSSASGGGGGFSGGGGGGFGGGGGGGAD